MKYMFKKIEPKWQAKWEESKVFEAKDNSDKPKFYGLVEFPYPSGAGMHVGHIKAYSSLEVISRKRRMEGYNVLFPIGFDAFGLPTENYAVKTGTHPRIITDENIKKFSNQLKKVGFSFDWNRVIDTTDEDYYKWTQWIFVKMFKEGLAYEKEFPINWCPSCKTGLANEEVVDGCCERCGSPVTKKNLKQWMLRITKYADRLLNDLDKLDWPEKVKKMQTDWIGKSYGAEVDFPVEGKDEKITVYTTRPDTLHGATFMVLAPEHAMAKELATDETREAVEKYIFNASMKSNVDRMQDVIKIRRGAKATITNALVKGTGGAIDLVDMKDSKGAGNIESSINITSTLSLTGLKQNGELNTFVESVDNTGADASLFGWTGYNLSAF